MRNQRKKDLDSTLTFARLVHLDRDRLEVYRRKAEWVFLRVHETIRALLGLAPTAFKSLFEHLRSRFPFSTFDIGACASPATACGCSRSESAWAEAHAVYSSNLLSIATYAPLLRERVLALLVDRMVDIDVQIAIDDEDERGAELAAVAAARKQDVRPLATCARVCPV
jgi:hypothetical protein